MLFLDKAGGHRPWCPTLGPPECWPRPTLGPPEVWGTPPGLLADEFPTMRTVPREILGIVGALLVVRRQKALAGAPKG